jgi:hypothetical protein
LPLPCKPPAPPLRQSLLQQAPSTTQWRSRSEAVSLPSVVEVTPGGMRAFEAGSFGETGGGSVTWPAGQHLPCSSTNSLPFGPPVSAVPALPQAAIAPGVWGMGCASVTSASPTPQSTTSTGVTTPSGPSECDDTTMPVSLMQSTSASGMAWPYVRTTAASNSYCGGSWQHAQQGAGWPVTNDTSSSSGPCLGIPQAFACQGYQPQCLGGAR